MWFPQNFEAISVLTAGPWVTWKILYEFVYPFILSISIYYCRRIKKRKLTNTCLKKSLQFVFGNELNKHN